MSKSINASARISNSWVILFVIFAVSTGIILYGLVDRHHHEMSQAHVMRIAKTTAENINHFRSYYSREVVSSALKRGIEATHEYKDRAYAIPLPATLSIELGEFMRNENAQIDYKMFSSYPFPWRLNRKLDVTETGILENGIAEEHTAREEDGRIRFFSPVIMGESCIDCHNTHPESPKTDWNVGDLRGYQEIVIPASFAAANQNLRTESFNYIILFFIFAFTTGLISIIFLAARNKKAFSRVQEYALLEVQKGAELEHINIQLEKSVGELNAVLDNAADAIITIDQSGRVISANAATQKIFGHEIDDLIGQNVNILMPDDHSEVHDDYLRKYKETGKGQIIGLGREVIARRADGESFPIELSIGEINLDGTKYFTGIIRDISGRKNAEAALRASLDKERLLSLVASKTDNAVIITNADGTIRWVNNGFERISGYSQAEMVGKRPGEVLQGPNSSEAAIAEMSEAIKSQRSFTAEIVNYAKTGEEYWVQIEAQPVFDDDGKLDAFIAIERDITETRRREDDLEHAREAAEQSNKSKSKFLAMMSHEIRTPLNAIIGSLSLLRDESNADDQLTFIDTAQTSAENLQTIISDILDISKLEAEVLDLEFSDVSIANVLTEVASVLEPRAKEKDIYLEWFVENDDLRAISIDVTRVRQVLINFVANAIKFTEEGGVRLRAYHSCDLAARGFFRIDVADTGVGISDNDQIHIFDEFWTKNLSVKNTAPGTGLGLAICRRLAQTMGGDVGVRSAVGSGSTFWLELPLTLAKSFPTKLNESAAGNDLPTQFTGHILLAEDNSANQLVITAMLKKLGLTCDTASNGLETLSAVKRRQYELILMDVNMPEMDGIEATRIMRQEDLIGRTPVVAITAHVMKGDRESLFEQGFNDYVPKPLSAIDLRKLFVRMSPKLDAN